MEPLSDRQLDELLSKWRAPDAPEAFQQRLWKARRGSWWKWLWTASIRLPVPVTLLIVAALAMLFVMAFARSSSKEAAHSPQSAGLQPVKRLELRIIRSNYE